MRLIFLIFFLFLISNLQSQNALPAGVIIVSVDGGKPAVMKLASMPHLKRMLKKAAYSWKAQTIFPSVTLPAHTSMLSGIEPNVHKILWNDYIKDIGPVTFPTVFSLAHAQGKKTALFSAKEKFKHFDVPGTLEKFYYQKVEAKQIALDAVQYLNNSSDDLVFIHFPDADLAGHASGWGSAEQKVALTHVDEALKTLTDFMDSQKDKKAYTLLITANHGDTDKGHGSNSPADMTIPWIAWGNSVRAGLIKAPVSIMDTAATALTLLGIDPPASWKGHFLKDAFILKKYVHPHTP